MSKIHHKKLPDFSTILSGRGPIQNEFGFKSNNLQIWYNNTDQPWIDDKAHAHQDCTECFIVTKGSILVEVEGEEYLIGPREYCYFPVGVFHRIIKVNTPVESFMIRAPSVEDKIYK